MSTQIIYMPTLENVRKAAEMLNEVVQKTPFHKSNRFSNLFQAHIYLKREDLQTVRSYKIRGAYHKMASLSNLQSDKGIVCASAGRFMGLFICQPRPLFKK